MEPSLSNTPLISIVDDDDSVRTAMGDMVESFGFRVGTFRSAAEFLQSDRLTETSCLILDIQMPGMTGLELHDLLVGSGRPIPTMFVTAFFDAHVKDRAMQAGALCCLAKPFDRHDLLNSIHAALQSRNPGKSQS
jgi:FixJ family two-component response regulator